MQNWLLLFVLFATAIHPTTGQTIHPAAVETQPSIITFGDVAVFYNFGKDVTFQVNVQPAEQVEHLFLMIQPEGQSTRVEEVEINSKGEGFFIYDAATYPLRPFARTVYWFRAELSTKESVESERYTFEYIDNRFTWRTIEEGVFSVNWYEGDLDFGQEAANTAVNGYQNALKYIPAELPEKVSIYIYSDASDLQNALQAAPQAWVAGHASPDISVVLVSVKPGTEYRLEMERQIPHELAHLMQYQMVQENYPDIPVWLIEGSASLAELYPNADYERVLANAVDKDLLLPMSSICASFPREASGAFLSYAQSASFVRYLQAQYGTSGLQKLFSAYRDGLGCDEGVSQTLGTSLTQLEQTWRRAELKMDTGRVAFQNLSPYLLILMVILVSPFAMVVVSRSRKKPAMSLNGHG